MLLRKILIGLLALTLMLNCSSIICASNAIEKVQKEQKTEVAVVIQPIIEKKAITFIDFIYVSDMNEQELIDSIAEITTYISYLEGLNEEDSQKITESMENAKKVLENYKLDLTQVIEKRMHYELCAEEYPEATRVWLYMKETFGWTDEICAGVMGNIMAEIGGGSAAGALNFGAKCNIDKNSGLGMFQWTMNRRKQIKSIYGEQPTIEQQLEFMYDELHGTDGVSKQVKDNELEKILTAKTPEEVAYNFARYFERCASFSYNARKNYAQFAYNYFVF